MIEKLGEKRSSYAEWEKETIPRADIFFKIATVLGVSALDLISEKWKPNEKSLGPLRCDKDEKESSANLETIRKGLDMVLDQQKLTRAEIRAYGQFQVAQAAKGDQTRIVTILAEIGKLVNEHEAALSREGIALDSDNLGMANS